MILPDRAYTGAQLLPAASGAMEAWFDAPQGAGGGAMQGQALVLHPQPLLGGHARHKVPEWLAKGLAEAGWRVIRPNFRGVGRSEGAHDHGRGETQDVLALCDALRVAEPAARLVLVGFSFGAFVAARVAQALLAQQLPPWRVVLTGMPAGDAGGRHYDTPQGLPDATVIHGERDDRVPLAQVLEWAGPAAQPVIVVPGADHFFSGRLPLLRSLVLQALRA